jgi:hypothetical protein
MRNVPGLTDRLPQGGAGPSIPRSCIGEFSGIGDRKERQQDCKHLH